jgi:pyruvate formate lyase activating enzyme
MTEMANGSATARPMDDGLVAVEADGIRCAACTRRCVVPDGGVGHCAAVGNLDGRLHSLTFGIVREATVTPVENRPVFHYRPGTRVLNLSRLGSHPDGGSCQRGEVAFRDSHRAGGPAAANLPPERAVELALECRCQGIAWTFDEPSISPMYTLAVARLAREAGLYTVFATNGLMTPEVLELLGPVLDVYCVDLRSLDRAFYRRVARTDRIDEILPVARRARRHFGVHVETVTNLMPGLNDSEEILTLLAERIVTELGPLTPWHLTSHVPHAKLADMLPAPVGALTRARAIGLTQGLRFVYTDLAGDASTHCPDCGALAVERLGWTVRVEAVGEDGRCAVCAAPLGMVP